MAIITVTGTSDSQYETRITNGRHTMTADEPIPLGTDLGPNPYEFLLSALGACTSITLFMYAGRKNWPLERVRIELTHDRVHADDCEQCEEESGLVDLIERKIRFEGPLDDEQRKHAEGMVALLTPVAKAFLTDRGLDTTIIGQQVFGGHGFIREWGQEQHVRDLRITQIYEGTNDIQRMLIAKELLGLGN